MDPAIRIVIPCHNCARTICRALDSLHQQSFQGFEAILVDDGSTDDTWKIITQYAAHSPLKLLCLSQRHAGAAAARNLGMEDCTTPYLMFLDADDVYHPDLIRCLYHGVGHGCDTAFCLTSRDVDAVFSDVRSVPADCFHRLAIDEAMEYFMYHKEQIHFTGFLYSREILTRHAIRFRSGVCYGEDLEFVWKYLAHCTNACLVHARLYGYENHPASAVHQVRWSKTDLADAMLRTGQYLRKQHPTFADSFSSYMLPRSMWTVAKTFALGRKWSMYQLFCQRYHLRPYMRQLAETARSRPLRLTARLYLLSPWLFYHGVGMISRLRRMKLERRNSHHAYHQRTDQHLQ